MTAPELLGSDCAIVPMDRAVAPLGDADGPPGLATLFETTGVAAVTDTTPAPEVLARLAAFGRRLTLARTVAVAILADAGWPDAERTVARALAGPAAPEAARAPDPKPSPLAVRYPALHLWRREVRAGVHGQRPDAAGTWRYDALWRAACWEAAAIQAERDDQPAVMAARMRCAREAIAAATSAAHERAA